MKIYDSQDVLNPSPRYGEFPIGTKSILLTNFASLYVNFQSGKLDITLPPVTALVAPVDQNSSWQITARPQTGTVNPSSEQYVAMSFQDFTAPLSLRTIHLLAPVVGQSPAAGQQLISETYSVAANTVFANIMMNGTGILAVTFLMTTAGVMSAAINNTLGTLLNGNTLLANNWYTISTPLNQYDTFALSSSVATDVLVVANARYYVN